MWDSIVIGSGIGGLTAAAALAPAPEEPDPSPQIESNTSLEVEAVEYLQRHDWNLAHAIRHLESVLVRGALTAAKGKQSEAARLLGISPRSVYNKLRKEQAS
jgi:DNA-binding NtrC family response regulator